MKKCLSLSFIIICVVAFCACSAPDSNSGNSTAKPVTEQNTDNSSGKELAIYTVNNNTFECEPITSVISPDAVIDATLIVNEVIANFPSKVGILKIEENKNNVVVYFDETYAPIKNVSSIMEESMLDCIAYSLLDNLDFCKEIYYRSSNDRYVSDNITLEKDEPYISK